MFLTSLDDQQLDLHRAIWSNDHEAVAALLDDEDTNVNYQDPATGFTPLHCAAIMQNPEYIKKLIQKGITTKVLDRTGFSATHYMYSFDKADEVKHYVNHSPLPEGYVDYEDVIIDSETVKKYRQYRVRESNSNLHNNDFQTILVENIFEMDEYIAQNPNVSQAGFIVPYPRCVFNKAGYSHVIPIYFRRIANAEFFIIIKLLDSDTIPIKKSDNPEVARYVYFIDLERQSDGIGCFDDTVSLFSELSSAKDFLQFCQQQAIQINHNELLLNAYEEKLIVALSAYYESDEIPRRLKVKERYSSILDYFYEIGISNIVTDIFKITIPHPILLRHIGRYDTMRRLRTSLPIMDQDSLTQALSLSNSIQGFREQNNTHEEMADNLTNPDKKYDFISAQFERHALECEQQYINKRYSALIRSCSNYLGFDKPAVSKETYDNAKLVIDLIMFIEDTVIY